MSLLKLKNYVTCHFGKLKLSFMSLLEVKIMLHVTFVTYFINLVTITIHF